ncbi:uncharacterized protein LOC141908530 [Tubulanus polymorphus]|uniref:uncharacterized protein LOC141908530 n=1 Tax=Tubulanus polymorphus TaxID=672921 RepID=UPI003DA216C3
MALYLMSAILWACLVPIAFVSTVGGIVALSHFRLIYRSLDVLLISLLSSLLVNCVIVVPLALSVVINNLTWSVELCKFFVWTFVTSRMVGIITLISISMDCLIMLRAPGSFRIYGLVRSRTVYVYVICVWILAIFTGGVPLIGWSGITFVKSVNNECMFMPFEIGSSFSIFMAVLEFASIFLSVICITDAFFCLKHAKRSYNLRRTPGSQQGLPKELVNNSEGLPKSAILEALDFSANAMDAWVIALAVVILCYVINHIPFMVICVVGAVTPTAITHGTSRTVVLWLLIAEGYEICRIQLYHKRLQLSMPRRRSSSTSAQPTPQTSSRSGRRSESPSYYRRASGSEMVDGDVDMISTPNGTAKQVPNGYVSSVSTIEEVLEEAPIHNLQTLPMRRNSPPPRESEVYTNAAFEPDVTQAKVTPEQSTMSPDTIIIYPDEDGTVRRMCTPVGNRTPSPDYSAQFTRTPSPDYARRHPYSQPSRDSSSSSCDEYTDSDIENVLNDLEYDVPQKTEEEQDRDNDNEQYIRRLPQKQNSDTPDDSEGIDNDSVSDNVPKVDDGRVEEDEVDATSDESTKIGNETPGEETCRQPLVPTIIIQPESTQPVQQNTNNVTTTPDDDDPNIMSNNKDTNWKTADKTLSLMEFLMSKEEGEAYLDTGQNIHEGRYPMSDFETGGTMIYDSRYPLREEEEITAFV